MTRSFGTILKEIRRSKNISQRKLAEEVGVDFSYISKIENDRLPPPAAETIIKISEALDIPNEILLSKTGKISNDAKDYLTSSPAAVRFLNELKSTNLNDEKWKQLTDELKKLR